MAHFRFFDLPRELRDQIYTHLIHPIAEIPHSNYLEVFNSTYQYLLDAPFPALLTTNKQLKSEYLDIIPKYRRFIMVGHTSDHFTCFSQSEPGFAALVDELTIYINVQCYCDHMSDDERLEFFLTTGAQCDGADSLDFYNIKIAETLRQFPNLKAFNLKLGVWGAEDKAIEWPFTSHTPEFAKMLEKLLALRCLKTIEVVKCSSQDDYWHYTRESVWRWQNKKTRKAEYQLGRGTHQLATFAKYEVGKGWEGGNGVKTKYAWGSKAR